MSTNSDHRSLQAEKDGSISFDLRRGQTYTITDERYFTIATNNDILIGLRDVGEVENHFINSYARSKSHVIKFKNGGAVHYSHNDAKQVIDLFAENISTSLDSGSDMEFFVPVDQNCDVDTAAPQQCRVQEHEDGRKTIHIANGIVFRFDVQGNLSGELPCYAPVGIRDLGEVENHDIQAHIGMCFHVVKFSNGGLLRFAYAETSQVIELYAEKLSCSMGYDNKIVFYIPDQQQV